MFRIIATFFGIGYIPKAPGTWGSLAALPICFYLGKTGPFVYMAVTIALTILAIISAEHFEKQSDKHDSKEIVIDEVVGMLITMTWLPLTWQSFLISFLMFRFLDIVKPFPISYFDKKVPGGFGVVADDVVAGVIGNIVLQVILNKTAWLGVQVQLIG